jgi:hypothetical protein
VTTVPVHDVRRTRGIDREIRSEQERFVRAPLELVWSLQTDVAQWTRWHPDVSYAAPLGPHRPGAMFEWVWRGVSTRTRVLDVVPCRRLAWTSLSARGTSVAHWLFDHEADGVLVTALVRLAPDGQTTPTRADYLQERALARWLDGLARAAELHVPPLGAPLDPTRA